MKKITHRLNIYLLLLAVLIVFASNANADIYFVVSSTHPADRISIADANRLFLGKVKELKGGLQFTPVNQKPGSRARKEFDLKVLAKSQSQQKAYWAKKVFTGKGTPPKRINNDDELLKLISENPTIIGYVANKPDDTAVKVILTIPSDSK